MPEYLEVYNLKNKFLGVKERNKFYKDAKKEFLKKKKVSKKVKTIRLIVLNTDGRIYLQRRSKTKFHNPNLYDKTIGGHVPSGYSYEMAVVKECAEELGFPAVILSAKEFKIGVKSTDLDVVGIFRPVLKDNNFLSIRRSKDLDYIQPLMTIWYVGYYNGSIKFKDGEAAGVETFSFKELESEIERQPDAFTEDVKYMMKKISKYLKPLNKIV